MKFLLYLKDIYFHYFLYGVVVVWLLLFSIKTAFPAFISAPIYSETQITTIQKIIFTDVVQYNIAFLSISLVVIVLIGGIFYIFNLKPLQDSLKKSEEGLEAFQSRVESNFIDVGIDLGKQLNEAKETMRKESSTLDEDIKKQLAEGMARLESKLLEYTNSAEKKVSEIDKAARRIELDALWSKHYMWGGRKIHVNELRALIQYLRLAVKYDILHLADLCMDEILQALDNARTQVKKNDDEKQLYISLLEVLDSLKGHEAKKDEVRKKAKEIMAN